MQAKTRTETRTTKSLQNILNWGGCAGAVLGFIFSASSSIVSVICSMEMNYPQLLPIDFVEQFFSPNVHQLKFIENFNE